MDAAWIAERGPPETIRYGKSPVPRPGPTDMVVRLEAVAVNPVDLFVRSGRYDTPLPFSLVGGRDVVGTVAACGPGMTGCCPGERMWSNSLGHAGLQGPNAELAVVPVGRLYHLPDSVDPPAAVAVLRPAASAFLALLTHGKLRSGETVLVAGGASHVGRVPRPPSAIATPILPARCGMLLAARSTCTSTPRVTTTSTWRPISSLAGGASC